MAATAAHPSGIWSQDHRRPSQVMHISPVAIPAMVPASRPQSPRSYQAGHMQLSMPMFGTAASMAPSMAYPSSSAYGFDLSAMNHYPVQQPINFSFQPQLQHPSTYTQTSAGVSPSMMVTEAQTMSQAHPSPSVKLEPSPIDGIHSHVFPVSSQEAAPSANTKATETPGGTTFSTDIDCLMRTIQSKSQSTDSTPQQQKQLPLPVEAKPEPVVKQARARKRYQCSLPNCYKSFYQKTHLEIHTRAHTGVKPFVCKEPACGQRFSQLGNLKTHERRHTGERPYQCDICGKSFAQRGNVRAHKIVHQQIKPYSCKLDDCGKQFTQLGNLKSHQNKFHASTVRYLTQKFSTIREGDPVTYQDKELWEYFSSLYKNSNKGIKGRGKDRRIWTIPSSNASTSSCSSHNPTGCHDDRSSRSSSYVSAHEMTHYNNAQPHQAHAHFVDHSSYGNMVFPER